MPYQTGRVGPIDHHQDNSGNRTDTDRTITYTPEQFGAPPGARIVTGIVDQQVSVSRGLAYVHNLTVTDDAISFNVFTQAANDSWFFGWHSGAITVSTSFTWYYVTERALKGGEWFFMQEGPAEPTRSAPAWLTGNPTEPTRSAPAWLTGDPTEPQAVQGGAAVGSLGTTRAATGARGTRTPPGRVGGGCAGCGQ
jgi:hypothetical protein